METADKEGQRREGLRVCLGTLNRQVCVFLSLVGRGPGPVVPRVPKPLSRPQGPPQWSHDPAAWQEFVLKQERDGVVADSVDYTCLPVCISPAVGRGNRPRIAAPWHQGGERGRLPVIGSSLCLVGSGVPSGGEGSHEALNDSLLGGGAGCHAQVALLLCFGAEAEGGHPTPPPSRRGQSFPHGVIGSVMTQHFTIQ